ncbi:MAG: NADH-quinone oxidoreductase subunit C [Thermoplasmatota archaeon]
MSTSNLSPKEILSSFKDEFSDKILDSRIEKHSIGPKKTDLIIIWMTLDRTIFKDAVKHLMTLEKNPHFAVSSGYDIEDRIEIIHHFSIYNGTKSDEISINFTVPLPKTDPTIDTISDLIPGALISEQEKQEMLGVKVKNIPKDTRVFISDDFPENMYPWRKDEKNADAMARNLHEPPPEEEPRRKKEATDEKEEEQ